MRKAPQHLRGLDPPPRNPLGAPERTPAVIRNAAEVEKLLNWTLAARRLPRGELVVAVPGLAEDQAGAVQTALNRSIRACGCAAAGSACLVGSAGLAVYALTAASGRTWLDLIGLIGVGLIAIVLVTAVAKWSGLYLARIRFRRSCRLLLRLISDARLVEPPNKERGNDVPAMG